MFDQTVNQTFIDQPFIDQTFIDQTLIDQMLIDQTLAVWKSMANDSPLLLFDRVCWGRDVTRCL